MLLQANIILEDRTVLDWANWAGQGGLIWTDWTGRPELDWADWTDNTGLDWTGVDGQDRLGGLDRTGLDGPAHWFLL